MRRSPRHDRRLTHASFVRSLLALLLPWSLRAAPDRAGFQGFQAGLGQARQQHPKQQPAAASAADSPDKAALESPILGIAVDCLQPHWDVQCGLAHLRVWEVERSKSNS